MPTWSWQLTDWPDFTWDTSRLAQAEARFLVAGGVTAGLLRSLEAADPATVTTEALTSEALTTSEIEGELLDRESVRSSILGQLGLAVPDSGRRPRPAEAGIAELLVSVHRTFADPLSHDTLFRWHEMIVRGRRDLHDVGRYRTHASPMQVVSGRLDAPEVHFEAPPSFQVSGEMDRFLAWFERTRPGGSSSLPGLTRAGLAHLYFVTIHPFEDGNGRIARAVAETALGQALGHPPITALATTILAHRREYYDALGRANRSNETTGWLAWFAGIVLEAQEHTQILTEFVLEKTRFLDRLRGQLNERQEKAVLRVLREGPSGFRGGLSAGNYQSITGARPATATRDLADLVSRGGLVRTGERRHARYHLPIQVRATPRITIGEAGEVQVMPTSADPARDPE